MLDSTSITFGLRKKYDTDVSSFFQVRKNTIFECARFNRSCQGEDETAEEFITALFTLAENCNYGDLREELIQDRLVIGIKHTALSEQLQLDANLTLDKSETRGRRSRAANYTQ